MEQRVLVVGTIISKTWDFEAMCLVDDRRGEGVCSGAAAALAYLFEGRAADEEFLQNIPDERMIALCERIWRWYLDDLAFLTEWQEGESSSGKEMALRDLYSVLFRAWGKLPDEIGRQRPKNLFYILRERPEPVAEDSEMQMLYGG